MVFGDDEDGPHIVTLENASELLLPHLSKLTATQNRA